MGLNTQVLGISIDHVPCLQAWADSLGGISYPLLSDFWPHGSTAEQYGVLRSPDGFSERAIFVIDAQGYIRHIEVYPLDQQPDNDALRQILSSLTPLSTPKIATPSQSAADEELPKGGIIIYCARWCKDCKRARAWMDEHNLEYVEVDIDYHPAARAQLRKWANGALVTPTIDVDGTIVIDFNVPELEKALTKAGKKF